MKKKNKEKRRMDGNIIEDELSGRSLSGTACIHLA